MISNLSIFPLALIPAVCLILLVLNNRLTLLLTLIKDSNHIKNAHFLGEERFFFLRARILQTAILCAYTAILFFIAAAFFIILSTIATHLMYIIVILLITGCFMTFSAIISTIVEVAYATTLLNNKEGIFRKR